MIEPLISVVIPCYNHGEFLDDAVNSIPIKKYPFIEIIIVNDGSTDVRTLSVLERLEKGNIKVIHQENSGLGAARNKGISFASGKYILPLDSDNELLEPYFSTALTILEENESVAVVYGNPLFFGSQNGIQEIPEFNLQSLITANFIDACAIFRKSAWLKVGGYDENMPYMGVEDWEFWLHLSFSGFKFKKIDEVAFKYRVVANSMIKKDTAPNYHALRKYMEVKHPDYLNYAAPINELVRRFKANPLVFLLKLVLISWFPSYYKKLVNIKKLKPL
jgi:glycosyltransferase involved in cell wall biosynthesis